MALNAATLLDVRQTGSESNGAGFNPANANFATDGTVTANTGNTATPEFSSVSYTFVAGDVGARLYIKSGSNSRPGLFAIVSVAAGKATVAADIGQGVAFLSNLPVALQSAQGIASVGTPTSLTWGIDYSQQDSAQFAFTDMVIDGTTNTKFTSAAKPVGKHMIGNLINVASGTGFTVQIVEVVSTSTITATCDKALGTLSSTGGHGNLGGGFATPGKAASVKVAGMTVMIKYNATAYILTTASANVSGGIVNDTTGGGGVATPGYWVGYNTTRTLVNTDALWPTMQVPSSGVTAITIFQLGASYCLVRNLIVDGNAKATITGLILNTNYNFAEFCKAINCTVMGLQSNNGVNGHFLCCEATGCSGTAGMSCNQMATVGCVAHGNTCHGFRSGGYHAWCIAYANTGASSDGFASPSNGYLAVNCVSYGNGRYGYDLQGNAALIAVLVNCIGYGNTGKGFKDNAGIIGTAPLLNCAGASGDVTAAFLPLLQGYITLTADPFTNGAAGDFSLNNTAGGGALLKAAGFPGVYPAGLTTGYVDIGAFQHADPTPSLAQILMVRPATKY